MEQARAVKRRRSRPRTAPVRTQLLVGDRLHILDRLNYRAALGRALPADAKARPRA